jgi:hypothetical protein
VRKGHPIRFAEEMGDQMRAFFVAPLEREYFDEWMNYLAAIYSLEISETRREATFEALQRANFTNAELGIAGDHIVANNERFPVPSHFIACPELGRYQGKS